MEKEIAEAAEIAPAAQKFLRDHIQSLWQLELILFMKEKRSALSAAEIATGLYSTPRMIESALSGFAKNGILKAGENQPKIYAYAPDTVELTEAIEQASAAYANRRLAVINFIFSKEGNGDS